jgi:hypothetical protein
MVPILYGFSEPYKNEHHPHTLGHEHAQSKQLKNRKLIPLKFTSRLGLLEFDLTGNIYVYMVYYN